jgi:cation diffusion facilitator CzcD-associated flavoprotein CzcO
MALRHALALASVADHELDAAIIGAGPFGLAVAAHLGGARVRVYGEPMRTWRRLMPPGMRLRSTWDETSFPSPEQRGSTAAYSAATGTRLSDPPALPTSSPTPTGSATGS